MSSMMFAPHPQAMVRFLASLLGQVRGGLSYVLVGGMLPWLSTHLTTERVAAWLAHLVKGRVTRYEVPGIQAFNFVCEQALGGGGMASLRNDPLGKGMGQILLSMPMQVPTRLLARLSGSQTTPSVPA